MNKLKTIIATGIAANAFNCNAQAAEEREKHENIILIICDDLRCELGCYGNSPVISPNIDKLAGEGVLFSRAYCNIAVSGASRASLLTGLRPTRNRFNMWNSRVDKDAPDAVTIQQAFKDNGYATVSNGKIYHHNDEKSNCFWDETMPVNFLDYHSDENLEIMAELERSGKGKRGYFYEHGDYADGDYLDAKVAEKSIKDMRRLSREGKPFFLGIGFTRPHLPFIVPERYWNMYDHDSITIPDNYRLKDGNLIPPEAIPGWSELRVYTGIPSGGPLDEETAKLMIHGYYAAVSYVDAQVGRIIDAVKELGLEDNTSIILIGDNGWNLGEHGAWCKHCILNTSLNVPMIIKSPVTTADKSFKNDRIVDFVDIYPTICDLAGIANPEGLEGESLMPLLKSPGAKSKGYAVCRWDNSFTLIEKELFYTEWWDNNDKTVGRLLFDHSNDPAENYNVAHRKKYEKTVKKMSRKLREKRGKNYFL